MPLGLNPAQMIGGGLMALVGLAAIVAARWRWGIEWRGMGCGAVLWTIYMVAKRTLDGLLTQPIPAPIRDHLANPLGVPDGVNLIFASTYVGLLTAVTLVLYTLIAGLRWRRLADDPRRAMGIGLGIGAFEAIFYGLKIAVGLEPNLVPPIALSATPILVLPVERLIVIACHTLAATMVLYAVATRRWRWFAAAFLYFTALDGLAGFYIITDASNRHNPWLLELTFAPFALIAIPILRHLWRHWPPPRTPLTSPEAAPQSPPAPDDVPPHARSAARGRIALPDLSTPIAVASIGRV
jgi:hypothetical protein